MRVNKEEMPLSEVRFVSKTHQHEKFEEWAKEMLAQPSMSKKLLELRIMRSITQSRRIAVEKKFEGPSIPIVEVEHRDSFFCYVMRGVQPDFGRCDDADITSCFRRYSGHPLQIV